MAGKSNTSATFFAQKKLLGKAHTSNLKVDGEEVIGSNIQAASTLIFGEDIPTGPSQTLYLIQSASNGGAATVEYIQFVLTALTGTTYDADSSGGGAGSDSGESSQSSGPHCYKFVMPSDYTSNSSNTREGNGTFNNNKIVHETLGALQLIPPFFSQDSPNPYIVKIFEDDGGDAGDEIPLLDNIDWNVDYYNGVLFLQDYDSGKIPAHAKAFAYVGKMLDEVVSSGSSGGGDGDPNATYLVKTATGSLSAERALVAGTGLNSADAGANGNFTLSVNNSIVATLTGSIFSGPVKASQITGSLTRLTNGTSYMSAGSDITVASSSAGQITVTSTAQDQRKKFLYEVTGSHQSSGRLEIPSVNFSNVGYNSDRIDIFVNGQLMSSGSGNDYSLPHTGSIKFTFNLISGDIVAIRTY